jgi:hypothetical protein
MTFDRCAPRIAFVGVDGSGKSTVSSQIAKWLDWRVSVGKFYMGKTRQMLPVLALEPLIRLARMAHGFCIRRFGVQSLPARLTAGPKELLEDLMSLIEGRGRLRAYLESCRHASEGAVALYDRYPLNSIWVNYRLLDGPRIATRPGQMRGLRARLARAEANLYRQIQPPDHIILLHVSPEILLRRRPEENGVNLAIKAHALQGVRADGFGLTVIEAEQPLEDVLAQVKQVVWNLL